MHSIREVNELLKKHLLPNVIHNKFKSGTPMNIWATCVTPRSSHGRCSVKNAVLKNFANFTGTPVLRSLFNKVAALHKIKRLQHRCLSLKFTKFLRNLRNFLKIICERLLLYTKASKRSASRFIFLRNTG